MTREEYDSLGHITETGNCCICGKEYTDYGYSTWGIWTAEEEKWPLEKTNAAVPSVLRLSMKPDWKRQLLLGKEKSKMFCKIFLKSSMNGGLRG